MKVVVADTGAIISLIHINRLSLIEQVLGEFFIPYAVWEELNKYDYPEFDKDQVSKLREKTIEIGTTNHLSMIMDLGESEAVILYEELKADFLLIDDSKARKVAESLNLNCLGSLGLLLKAKEKGYVQELKSYFEKWLKVGRHFSKPLLNEILEKVDEEKI